MGHLLKLRGAMECVRQTTVQNMFEHSVNALYCGNCVMVIKRQVEEWSQPWKVQD